jgi:hypothetical protein
MSAGYSWRGGNEGWLRYGAECDRHIIIIEPLFEEANRCRRLIVELMRKLPANGIGVVLPDLPGTGESLTDIETVRLADWHDAIAAVRDAVAPVGIAALRGGALLDGGVGAVPLWRFAPETGARIVRDLKRTQLSGSSSASPLYAGHRLSEVFIDELTIATLKAGAHVRTLRLESDAAEADAKVAGSPLWRRAEPGEDSALAAQLADDLVSWVQTCAVA